MIFPNSHYVTSSDKMERALGSIEEEMRECIEKCDGLSKGIKGLEASIKAFEASEKEFTITANQNVTWNAKCEDDVTYYGATCKYIGKTSSTATIFKGTLSATYTNSDGSTSNRYADSKVTLSTPAGQSLTLIIRQRVN